MWIAEFFVTPFLAMILTVGFLVASRRHISGVTAGLCVVLSYVAVLALHLSWLQPDLRDLPAMGAVMIAMAVPMIAAAGVYRLTGSLRPMPRAAASTAVGLLGVLASFPVGLIVFCAFTGGCW